MSMLIHIYDKQETLFVIKLRFLKILHAGQIDTCLKTCVFVPTKVFIF